MAPKRPAPVDERPPPADCTDDEEASTESIRSDEEGDSSDSDEPNDTKPKAPQPKPSSAPPQPRANSQLQRAVSSSESDSESGSDSDAPKGNTVKPPQPKMRTIPKSADPSESESESEAESDEPKQKNKPATATKPSESDSEADTDVTPVSTKPMEGKGPKQFIKVNLKRPRIESNAAPEDAAKTPLKKPNPGATRSLSQNTGEESSKKPLFQRVWSDEDELTLLEGMIEFWEKRGIDPSTNINSFHEFIKERLQLDVTPAQLVNKIRTCKKKFKNSEARAKNGKDRAFAKGNEQQTFELSRKLWGSEEGIIRETPAPKFKANGTASKKKPDFLSPLEKVKGEDVKDETRDRDNIQLSLCEGELSLFSNGRINDNFLRSGLDLITDSKREELEERWKKLNLAELQILSQRALMIHEQTNLILDAYKKSAGQ